MKIDKLQRNEYPVGLIVDIHDYCNAACKMCPYESLKHTLDLGKMDWALYTKIVDDFSTLIDRYKFRGMMTYCNMGEPFLENNLAQYVRYAEERGVSVYLNTNASLMTPHKIDLLIRSGFQGSFNISFHAATANLYKKIMGLEIKDSENNIAYLINHYNRKKISFNVIDYNWPVEEETNVRDFFYRWGFDIKINKPISRAGLVLNQRKHVRRLAGCDPGRVLYQMVVCHNGDVLLCCNDMSRKEIVGNMANHTVQEVWNGTVFKEYLERIYSGKSATGNIICNWCEESTSYWSIKRLIKFYLPDKALKWMQRHQSNKWGLSQNLKA
jgi:organic radical activating enzyme